MLVFVTVAVDGARVVVRVTGMEIVIVFVVTVSTILMHVTDVGYTFGENTSCFAPFFEMTRILSSTARSASF